jgi:hypothetical protein
MSSYPIHNVGLVNPNDSHTAMLFSSKTIPDGPHTMPAPGTNVQSAAGIYPSCDQKGGKSHKGKINRKKINKISRKYKMKGSKKTIRKHVRKIKSRLRSKYSRKFSRRHSHSRRHKMTGGYNQYQNNMPVYNTYSLGGKLSPADSALANPTKISGVTNEAIDNLNHAAKNAYGNYGAGSGFPSRGWF